MKGDFTRTTFRRRRHYRGVRLQQGRVQLDADFNEQSDITAHHDRQTASDLIGACGAPDVGGGFKISPAVRLAGLDLAGAAARAVGGRGTALGAANIDGSAAWTQDPTPTTNELHAVDAVDATRAFAVGEGATILIASGAAWAAQSAPSGTTGALRGVSFADASNGFAVGDGALILATTNGGTAWAKQNPPSGVQDALHGVFAAAADRAWAVGDSGRILARAPGDTNWVVRNPPAGFVRTLRAVRFRDASNGIAVGDGAAILTTADGGQTWTRRGAPAGVTAALRSIDLEGANAWAVGDGPTVLRSTDGGASWTRLEPPAGLAGDLTAVRARTGGAVVAGDLSGLARVAVSGTTANWTMLSAPAAARDVAISAGTFYVGGVLCENERPIRFLAQPDLPGIAFPSSPGPHLFYLDVWQRHLTALERDELREVALGGPDTATRTQTVWQVRQLSVPANSTCASFSAGWAPPEPRSTARLAARGTPQQVSSTDCMVPAQGGYRRLENQLYRVEVLRRGTAWAPPSPGTQPPSSAAHYGWSRDNAATVTRLLDVAPGSAPNTTRLKLSDLGRDKSLGFGEARWVELTDEGRVLRGDQPLKLYEVDRLDGQWLVVKTPSSNPAPGAADVATTTTVRRWDDVGPVLKGDWDPLEGGVEVRFDDDAQYEVGDHWTIPARTNKGAVEWPAEGGAAAFQPREGVEHRYCPLALLDFANGAWTAREEGDCRPLFTPLAEHVRAVGAGGDGQEATLATGANEAELPFPLEVAVMRGARVLPGRRVMFETLDGPAGLAPDQANHSDRQQSRQAATGPDGVARVRWWLRDPNQRHRVRARLLNAASQPLDAPVHFNAFLHPTPPPPSGGACTITVPPDSGPALQEALEKITEMGGGEICIPTGLYEIGDPFKADGLERVTISGRGPSTVIRSEHRVALHLQNCREVTVRGLRIEGGGGDEGEERVPFGALQLFRCRDVTLLDCQVLCRDREGDFQHACVTALGQSSEDDDDSNGRDALVRLERCRLEAGPGQVGLYGQDLYRLAIVSSEIALPARREGDRLGKLTYERAAVALEHVLQAGVRSRRLEESVALPLGRSEGEIAVHRRGPTPWLWSTLAGEIGAGDLARLDVVTREFAQRVRGELSELLEAQPPYEELPDPDSFEVGVEAPFELAFALLAWAMRAADRGVRLVSPSGPVELSGNVISGVRVGFDLRGDEEQAARRGAERAVIERNTIDCVGTGIKGDNSFAALLDGAKSVSVVENRSSLLWVAEPEEGRAQVGNIGIRIAEPQGRFLIVRHSDLHHWPVGVRVIASPPEEGEQRNWLWLVAETMLEGPSTVLALQPNPAVEEERNYRHA
jgi:photosystem II stability/assembly factor-like uncharacterized protein